MEKNDKSGYPIMDKRARKIIKRVIKKIEAMDSNKMYPKNYYVHNQETNYLN